MSDIVDFHSHILPGIDDGSASVEQSIAMLKMEAAQGISRVIATPHFYAQHHKPDPFLEKRARAEEQLRQELRLHPELPQVEIGAEVYYFNGISHCDVLPELTIGKKRYILIEMPLPPWNERMYRELDGIWVKQGLIPIIAHVDRYIAPLHTHKIPQRLAQLPVLIQANASFFTERATRRMALRMLKQGMIHLLGSDCHNLSDRAPNLGEALQIISNKLGQQAISEICAHQDEVLSI